MLTGRVAILRPGRLARADELRHLVELGGPRARRLQDIESDTGYNTRRRGLDGGLVRVSQTTQTV